MKVRQAWISIHVAALLFGLTGIFGELIAASAVLITAGRALFAVLALYLVIRHGGHRHRTRLSLPVLGVLSMAGILLTIHWITFFLAVKVGGIAIATLGFASFPAFITLFEGLIYKERATRGEWLVVLLVSVGLILVTPSFNLQDETTTGFAWAILSGLTFALFTLANRQAVMRMAAREVACWENFVVVILTLPWCFAEFITLGLLDWVWLIMLGVFCTAISHALMVSSLSRLKARSAGIVIALEPIYAIFFAAILFAQYPSLRALAGGALIISAIVWVGMRSDSEQA